MEQEMATAILLAVFRAFYRDPCLLSLDTNNPEPSKITSYSSHVVLVPIPYQQPVRLKPTAVGGYVFLYHCITPTYIYTSACYTCNPNNRRKLM